MGCICVGVNCVCVCVCVCVCGYAYMCDIGKYVTTHTCICVHVRWCTVYIIIIFDRVKATRNHILVENLSQKRHKSLGMGSHTVNVQMQHYVMVSACVGVFVGVFVGVYVCVVWIELQCLPCHLNISYADVETWESERICPCVYLYYAVLCVDLCWFVLNHDGHCVGSGCEKTVTHDSLHEGFHTRCVECGCHKISHDDCTPCVLSCGWMFVG